MFTSKIWLMNGIENFIQIRCRDTYDGLLCSKRTRRYGNFIDGEQKKNIERTSLGSIEWNAQTHVLVVYFTHQPPTTLVVSDDSTSAQQCSEFRRRGDKDWHTCKHEPTHISRCRGRHRREFCTQDESQQQKGPRASGGSEWAHTRVCAGMCADRLLVGRKKKMNGENRNNRSPCSEHSLLWCIIRFLQTFVEHWSEFVLTVRERDEPLAFQIDLTRAENTIVLRERWGVSVDIWMQLREIGCCAFEWTRIDDDD